MKKYISAFLVLILVLSTNTCIYGSPTDSSYKIEKAYKSSLFYRESSSSSQYASVTKLLFLLQDEIEYQLTLSSFPTTYENKEITITFDSNNYSVPSIIKKYTIQLNPSQKVYSINIPLSEEEKNAIEYGFNGESFYTIRLSSTINNIFSHQLYGYGEYQMCGNTYVNYDTGNTTNTVDISLDPSLYEYYIGFQYARTSYSAGFNFSITDLNNGSNLFNLSFKQNEVIKNPDLMHQYSPYDTARILKTKLPINVPTVLRLSTEVFSSRWGAGSLYILRKPIPYKANMSIDNTSIGDNTPISVNIDALGVPGQYVDIYNANNNTSLYKALIQSYPAKVQIPLGNIEGNISIGIRIVNSSNAIILNGNRITINKNNILNRMLSTANEQNGLPKFLIVDEVNRYFEDNSTNRSIVQQIKAKANGTFLIYNDVSPVLQPLLEP